MLLLLLLQLQALPIGLTAAALKGDPVGGQLDETRAAPVAAGTAPAAAPLAALALEHWTRQKPQNPLPAASCSWTDSTLLLGVVEYAKVANGTTALASVRAWAWAARHHYALCGAKPRRVQEPPRRVRGHKRAGNGSGTDDSCRVAVRDVAYVGDASGKSFPVASFGDCCARCGALGYPRCSDPPRPPPRLCSLQGEFPGLTQALDQL
jgi:hypothetical protein